MRLTCPNCEAQYEVPDEVIPTSGRDVQCSNCGDTWFQHHPDHEPEEQDEQDEAQAWDAAPEEAEPDAPAEPESVEEPEAEDIPEPEEAPEPPARRELDPQVSEVLREEADRERAAREQDAGGLETQPDLGLEARDDDADKRSREAQARMARLRGEPEEPEAPEEVDLDPGTRRNLLPDIDEINSSLSSDSGDAAGSMDPGEVETPDTGKGGFRRGFYTVLLLAVIGLLLYMFAPQLARAVPALEGVMMTYVAIVDALRGWLDGTVRGLMGTLDGMSSEGGSGQ